MYWILLILWSNTIDLSLELKCHFCWFCYTISWIELIYHILHADFTFRLCVHVCQSVCTAVLKVTSIVWNPCNFDTDLFEKVIEFFFHLLKRKSCYAFVPSVYCTSKLTIWYCNLLPTCCQWLLAYHWRCSCGENMNFPMGLL